MNSGLMNNLPQAGRSGVAEPSQGPKPIIFFFVFYLVPWGGQWGVVRPPQTIQAPVVVKEGGSTTPLFFLLLLLFNFF